MGTILYGNLRVEIVGGLGARADRLSVSGGPPSLIPRPFRAHEESTVPLLGRDEQISEAYAAAGSRRPIEFTATCGYGKSTLLRHIAAHTVYDGVAHSSVYLLAGPGGLHDLLQRLVAELFTSDPPVKPTPEQCAELLGQVRAVIMLDDVMLDPGQVDYLLRVLAGCSLVLGTPRPVLGRHGTSHILAGLPGHAAVELITSELGRQLTGGELAAVEHLAAAVDGQPLHLRQAAALVRENGLSFEWLARIAERAPEELDRLSIRALARQERRALAVLALAAGALMPANLVGTMGDIASIGQPLGLLHRRGLAVQHADRFGLPICKVGGYRQMLLKDLQLATALREFAGWLANRDPTTADSLSAAGAALGIIEWAAERGDWPAVVRLVRVAEPILTLAGRWEASSHILGQGLEAARATGDHAAEALFEHQQGTLAFCRDELSAAKQLLEHALRLREWLADSDGAAVTRHNLQLLQPAPPPPPRDRPARSFRKTALAVGSALIGLTVLTLGVVKAATSDASHHRPPTAATTPAAGGSNGTPTGPAQDGGGTGGGGTGGGGTGGGGGGGTGGGGGGGTDGGGGGGTGGGGGGGTGGGGGGGTDGGGGGGGSPLKTPVVQPADFGQVDITPGQAPAGIPVAVSNPNTRELSITSAEITSGPAFTITVDNCSASTIPPHQSCSVTVQFAPTALGSSSGTLTIASAADQPATAQLTGTGFVILEIIFTGMGSGSVGSDAGFSCQSDCKEHITSSITLSESPADAPSGKNPYVFVGWGKGACADSGSQETCGPLDLTADDQVTAQFDENQP